MRLLMTCTSLEGLKYRFDGFVEEAHNVPSSYHLLYVCISGLGAVVHCSSLHGLDLRSCPNFDPW